MEFSRQNSVVGCHSLLQGIFLTQGLNPCLLHYRGIFYYLSHCSRKWSEVKVIQSCLTLSDPMEHGNLKARILERVAGPFSRKSFQPRIKPRSPTLQADSLPAEPQGKPKNTGVGRLSLLQQIFPTQESNQSLLHCRHILYQLSYWGRPHSPKGTIKEKKWQNKKDQTINWEKIFEILISDNGLLSKYKEKYQTIIRRKKKLKRVNDLNFLPKIYW